jgi:hypothetical protein|tara:strand:+ start:333 stop:548 length:216 start_codon:yes stop_codon:yes gene_type:complete
MKTAVTYESVINQLQDNIAKGGTMSIDMNINFQIWEANDYLEENDWRLTKHQKQELQRAIDDLWAYKVYLK